MARVSPALFVLQMTSWTTQLRARPCGLRGQLPFWPWPCTNIDVLPCKAHKCCHGLLRTQPRQDQLF